MANAYKCDVVNCTNVEDTLAGQVIIEAMGGTTKHLCQGHTVQIVKSYFPDLIPKEEPPLEAQPEIQEE